MKTSGLFVLSLLLLLESAPSLRSQTFSVNAVGYHTVNVPRGWYFVANNFNYKNNLLSDVLPLPDWADAWFFKFDSRAQQYLDTVDYVGGFGWYSPSDPAPTLNPGEGALLMVLSNGAPAPITLTFVGDIAPRSCRTIYAGWNFWSPSLGGDMSESQPHDYDSVYTWDMLGQAYRDPWSYIEGYGWFNPGDPNPNGPRIPPGQSVLLFTTVTRNPCVIEGAAPSSLLSPLASTMLLNPTRSGSSFSFEFQSEAGKTYQVQSTDIYPGTFNPRGAPLTGNGQVLQFTDATASGPSRYYRLSIQ